MPLLRQQAKQLKPLDLKICEQLIISHYHEVRLFALLMLVAIYQQKKPDLKTQVFECYLNNTQFINNGDLVDCST